MLVEFSEFEDQHGLLEDRVVARLITPLLVLYWLALFAGTHWPRAPQMSLGLSDKSLHFLAFCGLGFLLSAARSISRIMTVSAYGGIFCVIGLYAAIDEISQIPVGRDCEWLDFRADLMGAVLGIGIFAGTHALIRMAYPALSPKQSRAEA